MIFVLGGSKCGFSSALLHYRSRPSRGTRQYEFQGFPVFKVGTDLANVSPGLVHCFLPECLYTLDLGFIEL